MRAFDRRATDEFGIPSLLLMENAGRGVADLISSQIKTGRIAIFCGKGNNGGDGFVVARHLYNRGYDVQVFLIADPQKLKGDAAINYAIIAKMNIPNVILSEAKDLARFFAPDGAQNDMQNVDLIVDAIFGFGLRSNVEGLEAEAIKLINKSCRRVLSIDIPSGLDADTGEVRGVAVKAEITATLAVVKQGLVRGEGPGYSGKIHLVDIGFSGE